MPHSRQLSTIIVISVFESSRAVQGTVRDGVTMVVRTEYSGHRQRATMGGTLGSQWRAAGHDVVFGARGAPATARRGAGGGIATRRRRRVVTAGRPGQACLTS